MNINVKQISFVILGLVIVTAIFGLSKFNIATAAKKDGKKFDDWVVSCSSGDKETKTPEVCILSQQVSFTQDNNCLLYTSPSPRDLSTSRMPSSA